VNGAKTDDPASKVIVIHPGGRTLRIGRSSDNIPLPVPNLIARRLKDPSRKHKYSPCSM
jgi:actin-related protein 8